MPFAIYSYIFFWVLILPVTLRSSCLLKNVSWFRGFGAGECEARREQCLAAAGGPAQARAVCGTNNQTYAGRCDLLLAQCQGLPVAVKHRGRCRDLQPCWSHLRQGSSAGGPGGPLFVPDCLEDGTYAPVQCYRETGICWCVTAVGKLVPNTSERFATPQCSRRGKSSPRRRSSSAPRGQKQKKGNKNDKNCSRFDRTQFSNNILKKFKADYLRSAGNSQPQDPAEDDEGDLERKALAWKFAGLDRDGDQYLAGEEYKELRRLIRRAARPRKCGKHLTKVCDRDGDGRVSRDEWGLCLGLDFNHEVRDEPGSDEPSSQPVLQRRITSSVEGIPDLGDDFDSEQEVNDCLSERQGFLDEQSASNTELYVPECTPDGRFQKKQCYKSTGYCWCVHEDDGKPIPGTSMKNQDPECDKMPPVVRPMPGCPEPKKQTFLKELMEILRKKMQAAVNKTATESVMVLQDDWYITAQDVVAKWNFNSFDKNKNKVLDKKEWKGFRALVTSSRQARKCGKKLPRYCDANHDRRISLTEWLNCVRLQPSPSTYISTPTSRRHGANPLQMYLNGD
ncbi:SPARC-related modular calcium-binding protein 1 isoform X2 [Bacillus rossius redtenbacheri]|uniref:SPARC-related modular calcium-binding protein 1 isoform X2 n=1 Tax=Bacillus rossius redtenbacheri TaxID=93214 RepID=UPI002FDE4E60